MGTEKKLNETNLHLFIQNEDLGEVGFNWIGKEKLGLKPKDYTIRIHRIRRPKDSGKVWHDWYEEEFVKRKSTKLMTLGNGVYDVFYNFMSSGGYGDMDSFSFVVVNRRVYLTHNLKFSNEDAKQFFLNKFEVQS